MKRARLLTALVGFAIVASLASDASARYRMYNPATGAFMQRDPVGMPAGPPTARNLSDSRFTQRDPTEPYADGMNLYQYVNSAPTVYVDPLGLKETDCGVKVHRIFPKKMENSTISKSDIGHTWLEYNGKTTGFAPGGIYSPDPWHTDPGSDKSWDAPVDSSAWFRRMKAGDGEGKKCACVTCQEVYDCLDKVTEEWKGVKWNFKTANCRHFVRSALDACCLIYPISAHPIRKELRILTIVGFGPLGALIPLPEIEEGDI